MNPTKLDQVVFDFFEKNIKQITFLFLLLLSLAIRLPLFPFVSGDMDGYLFKWCSFIQTHGGIKAFAYKFSDYTPLYLYFLLLVAKLKLPVLYAVKLLSVLFDYLTAWFVLKIVKLKYPRGWMPYAAFFAVLVTPTVILNSSLWGQCDIIYTFFSVASLYYLLKGRITTAFFMYGLSFSLKLQAIFLLPLLLVAYLKNRNISIFHFLLIPIVYLITAIPCILAGRGIIEVLTIHFSQMSTYDYLTMNATSIFQLFPIVQQYLKHYCLSGVFATLFFTACFSFIVIKSKKLLNNGLLIQTAFMYVLIIPFLLPRMHERYFFMADVISIIVSFYFLELFYSALLVIVSSYFSYLPYLYYNETSSLIDLKFLSLALLLFIIFYSKKLLGEFVSHQDVAD